MLNFINMLTGNVPPHKPPRGKVRTITMEGSRASTTADRIRAAARIRSAESLQLLGNEARVRMKAERKTAMVSKLRELGPTEAAVLADAMKASETNTRTLLRELIAEGRVTATKVGHSSQFKAV